MVIFFCCRYTFILWQDKVPARSFVLLMNKLYYFSYIKYTLIVVMIWDYNVHKFRYYHSIHVFNYCVFSKFSTRLETLFFNFCCMNFDFSRLYMCTVFYTLTGVEKFILNVYAFVYVEKWAWRINNFSTVNI